MNSEQFQQRTGVSRETTARLAIYIETLKQWQTKINLVAASTLDNSWQRHIYDSWQLASLIDIVSRETAQPPVIADIGSGAGFPGMVLAILGVGAVHLIEQDQKKAAFLREINRLTKAKAIIHAQDVETVSRETVPADIITCRAFAQLDIILQKTSHLRHKDTKYILLKSQDIDIELENATKSCNFNLKTLASASSPGGLILEISHITSKGKSHE